MRFIFALSALLLSAAAMASPCDPLMVYNNQTTDLIGSFVSNDASGGGSQAPEESFINVDSGPGSVQQQVWPNSACHTVYDSGDKAKWEAFYRVLTRTFFYNEYQTVMVMCLPDDSSYLPLKNTKTITATLSRDAYRGEYTCKITREGD
jgi:hypothetical protein